MRQESDWIHGYIGGLEDASGFVKKLADDLPPDLAFAKTAFQHIADTMFEKAQSAKIMHNIAISGGKDDLR